MAYISLFQSLVSVPKGKGLVLAINGELLKLWNAINSIDNTYEYDSKSLTIASGIATFATGYNQYILDTEAGAATDSLTKFADVPAGVRIMIRAANAGRVITLVNGSFLKLQDDFTLNSVYDNIILVGDGSDVCFEESRTSIT